MTQIKLSKRLEAIAALVPPYGGVVDVGTDHGYIPVYLAQSCHSGSLYATDINQGPIEHARQTAKDFDVEDKISFYLCNGLEAIHSSEISTIIIAGMGGENIVDILARAPWTKQNNCLLILQPMSKSSILRSWLFDNGFKVLSEQLVDDGTIYEILTASAGKDMPYSPAERLIGHGHLISADPLLNKRLSLLIDKAKKTESGLSSSSKSEDIAKLNEIKALILSLQNLLDSNV